MRCHKLLLFIAGFPACLNRLLYDSRIDNVRFGFQGGNQDIDLEYIQPAHDAAVAFDIKQQRIVTEHIPTAPGRVNTMADVQFDLIASSGCR
jgi:hypothetical protein